MKKILFSLMLAGVGLLQSANAEQSGIFMGAGLGFGHATLEDFTYVGISGITFDYSQGSFEILTGYKQFFTDDFGLRYYVDVSRLEGNFMSYTFNVDAMYNFASNDTSSLGAFLGLGASVIAWEIFSSTSTFTNPIRNGLTRNLGLNAGLRAMMTQHHSIEIAARVPFNADYSYGRVFSYDTGSYRDAYTHTYNFNIGLRYVFNY